MIRELSLINSRLDGRYDIKELLGRGSYAEIYVAHDNVAAPQSAHRKVVIKALNVFMQNDLDADLERTLVENFQNEAIALDRVRHPNIISRLGHGTARDLRGMVFHYLVLEYLPGGDLSKACREKTLSFRKSFGYLEQVCAGLAHAHNNGVIHRDIKPQNLLLTADRETVKIADFGVARFSASDSPITRVGTNIYAPPEHSPMLAEDGKHFEVAELTPAADIYSLAKTAYVLFTCESPRFFSNQPIRELPFASRQEPWASELLEVLQKATRNNPKDRHQDIYEFWKDFGRLKAYATEDGEVKTEVAARSAGTPKAHVSRGYTPLAPQQPRFNTSRELKFENNQVSKNPALVVKVGNAAQLNEFQNHSLNHIPAGQPPVAAPNGELVFQEEIEKPKRPRNLMRRAATFLVVICLFTGILYATHSFLRGAGVLPEFKNPFAQPNGTANTDANLRTGGDPNSQIVGMVPKNSRVRIVNSKDNWYEVDIIEYGRPKKNQTDSDHGWVYKPLIDVQE
ncbi:MAG TPA: serine/threonine protein kinase [Pyrinomonadaceae bacterium]|jgi:serine/threonine protein kinase